MIIRTEERRDFTVIYRLVKRAFETAEVSDGQEQEYVIKLRGGRGYIPQLALVAEEEGALIGYVMLTKILLKRRAEREVLLLAPLSVALEYRGRGVGSRLVNEALERASARDWEAVFLVGDPDYYGRFGFLPAAGFGIASSPSFPEKYVLAHELRPGSLDGESGAVIEFA